MTTVPQEMRTHRGLRGREATTEASHRRSNRLERLPISLAILVCLAVHPASADTATGTRGAIATVQPLATQAGMATFQSGGNAVDAAIAAASHSASSITTTRGLEADVLS